MNILKYCWNSITTVAGNIWNGAKDLANGIATGMMLYMPQTATATANLINTDKQINANFQMEAGRLVSRKNTLDTIESNRQNTNNRIVADWHLQQDRHEFSALMETRRQEFRMEELQVQWINQYDLQKDNQQFTYEEARRKHDEAIQLANLSHENQQKIERFRQEWENIRLQQRQDFEQQLIQARQEHEWNLRKYDRETMFIQASIQLQNMMMSAEYQRILNNHPLISNSVPTLNIYRKFDASKPVPLLVIISPPAVEFEKFSHAGQGLAKIETALTDKLREFLQDSHHYPVESSIRPTKFLGGVWDSKRLHSEGAMENLYYTHQSIPTLILESKVDGDFINIYIASWDSMDIHYRYKRILSIPWKDLLYPLARENARLWRETRIQLMDEGKTPKEIAEEGGDDEENLKVLEAEKRDQQQGRNRRRDYRVNEDEYIQELAEFLGNVHCILAGLAADQYHLYHYDVMPLLPTLLPDLLAKIDDTNLKNEIINIIFFIYRGIYQTIKLINPYRVPNLALDFALNLTHLDDKFWARGQINYALISWLELRDASLIPEDVLLKEDNLNNQVELTKVLLTVIASVVIPADLGYVDQLNQCLTALGEDHFSIVDACFERGMRRMQASQYNLAITDFDQVIQLDAQSIRGHYQRGLAYLKLKQPDQAIPDFTCTLELQPNYAEAFRYRGDAYNQLGNRASSINDLNTALAQYEQAVQDYNQAIGLGITSIIEKRDDVADKIDGIRQEQAKIVVEPPQIPTPISPPPQVNLVTSRADLRKLDQLLSDKKWKEADQETGRVMLKIMNREKEEWLTKDNCRNFPKNELRIIDQLWLKHSNDKFGFSVQKKIWLKLGGKLDCSYDSDTYVKLANEVGWRKGGSWLSYSDLTFKISAPVGHLPCVWVLWDGWWAGGADSSGCLFSLL